MQLIDNKFTYTQNDFFVEKYKGGNRFNRLKV